LGIMRFLDTEFRIINLKEDRLVDKYAHDCPFEAYVTNLGLYNEGELVGEWVKFPTDSEHFKEVLNRIGLVKRTILDNPMRNILFQTMTAMFTKSTIA